MFSDTEKAENKVTSPAPESGSLTSFHQLLLLRLLRPDRLHIAMADYVSIHLNLVDESEKIPDVKSVMDFVAKYQHGVLVLLPPGVSNESVPLTSRVKLSVPPSHVIQAAAQVHLLIEYFIYQFIGYFYVKFFDLCVVEGLVRREAMIFN